ncbi:hypothetical protein HDU85_001431, partial [Gaertneriomyces sp. JEL0708]
CDMHLQHELIPIEQQWQVDVDAYRRNNQQTIDEQVSNVRGAMVVMERLQTQLNEFEQNELNRVRSALSHVASVADAALPQQQKAKKLLKSAMASHRASICDRYANLSQSRQAHLVALKQLAKVMCGWDFARIPSEINKHQQALTTCRKLVEKFKLRSHKHFHVQFPSPEMLASNNPEAVLAAFTICFESIFRHWFSIEAIPHNHSKPSPRFPIVPSPYARIVATSATISPVNLNVYPTKVSSPHPPATVDEDAQLIVDSRPVDVLSLYERLQIVFGDQAHVESNMRNLLRNHNQSLKTTEPSPHGQSLVHLSHMLVKAQSQELKGPDGNHYNQYQTIINILTSTGFDIKLPRIPHSLITLSDGDATNELVNNLSGDQYAQRAQELRDCGFAPLEQKTRDAADMVLSLFGAKVDETQTTTNWRDVLVAPQKNNSAEHTKFMSHKDGYMLIKLTFYNSQIALVVQAAILRWINSTANAKSNDVVAKHLATIKSSARKNNQVDDQGFRTVNTGKRNNFANAIDALKEHIQSNIADADQSSLAMSVMADELSAKALNVQYVSLRLQRFNRRVMFWDMQNCPIIQRTLKKALNLDQNRCRITYAKLNNALTSKIDIMLPEVDVDKLLHEISVANLCDVIGSVTVKGTNKWQSVQLIKAYNDLRMSAAQPIAQPNNDEMSDVEPINSEPPTSAHHIISYSKILARGLEHKLEKLNARTENRKQPNRAAATSQQRDAGNNDDAKESDANHTPASQPNDHPSNDHRSRKRQRQSDETRSNEVIQLTQMITEMRQTQAEMLKELRETRSRNNILESTVQLLTTAIATLISNQS